MEKRKILHCRESNPDRPTERYTDWAIPPSYALGIRNRMRSQRLRIEAVDRYFIFTSRYLFAKKC
jgi:hypothetical protein